MGKNDIRKKAGPTNGYPATNDQQALYEYCKNEGNPTKGRISSALALITQLIEDRARLEHAIGHLSARNGMIEAHMFALTRSMLQVLHDVTSMAAHNVPGMGIVDKGVLLEQITVNAEEFAKFAQTQPVALMDWMAGGELCARTEAEVAAAVQEKMREAAEAGEELVQGVCNRPDGECQSPNQCTDAGACQKTGM